MSVTKRNAEESLCALRAWKGSLEKINWVVLALLVVGCLPAEVLAQPKPTWVSTQTISSDDGYGTLRWSVDGDRPIALFRITEDFAGQQSISFTDQAELKIFRINNGKYTFKVQACERTADGFPKCGKASAGLSFNVSTKVDNSSAQRQEVGAGEAESSASINIPGGPDQLRPGLWHNPARPGHGWSFYWANRLALPETHALYGYEYDLVGIWYTYEAKLRYRDGPPPCGELTGATGCFWAYENYGPLVANLKLVRTANNAYSGGIYITRSGVEYLQGSVTVTFGSSNTSASINWNANFKWQSLSGSDAIAPLAAAAPANGNAGPYGGIWTLPGNTGIRIADDIGAASEAVEIAFFDSGGDPTWIQAVNNATPSTGETHLCFYFVQGGYAPNATGALSFHQSGCDPNLPVSASNRNGLRYFTGFEQGRFWVSYDLGSVLGLVRIGTATSPALVEKRANFHRIFWNSTSGPGCELSTASPSCTLALTWFTDGDYPQAGVFRFNQSTGLRELMAVPSGPAVTDYATTLAQAGIYLFELRMTTSPASALLAVSSPYSVTSSAIAMPGNLNIAWIDQSTQQFRVAWSHPVPSAVSIYQLEESRPAASGSITYAVSPGTLFEKTFDYRSGPFGTYSYRIRACNGTGVSAQCSGWTNPVSWQLEVGQVAAHPWSSQVQGTLVSNASLHYAMGYHFRPEVSGIVTELGGFYNGTKRIRMFERSTGNLLAETTLASNNNWRFASINPVPVVAGTEYTVAVYLAGTGGSYSQNPGLPLSRHGIRILGSTYISTSSAAEARPTNLITTTMYGQVDIGFVAGTAAPPQNLAPVFVTRPGPQSGLEGDSVSLQIQSADPDGDTLSYSHDGTLPPGLSLTAGGLIQGTLAAGSSANSPYSVTIGVTDGILGHEISTSFIWSVSPGTSAANPEVPPEPAAIPSLAVDAASSRVGTIEGSFRVTDTGGAHFSMPIRTAPGSGGLVPRIAIEWSSQNGDGPLGVGGALGGVSAISRCGQTFEQDGAGYDGGVTLTPNDRFCLDGQRLMAITGDYGANGTEYRTEVESFARVISYGVAGNGPASFKAWLKDGSVVEFGGTQDSRIEARSVLDRSTVLTWSQNRLADAAGNYVDYAYSEMSGGAGDPVETVLQSVRYTGNSRAGTSPYAQIDFTYSSQRPDTKIAFAAGAATRQGRLLQRIDSRARVAAGSNLVFLRSYHLSYGSDGFGNAVLESVAECNDAAKTYCFPPTVLGWQRSRHEVGTASVGIGSVFNSQHRALAMADITGDGRPDLLLTERSGSSYRFRIAPALSTGSFASPGSTVYSIPNNGTADAPASLHTIDMNADGFQDVIFPTAAGWKGRISTGTALGAEISLSGTCCGLSDPPLVRIMDFDGDGLSDLVTSRAASSNQREIVFLRNRFSARNSADVGFHPPQLLTFTVSAGLFPEAASGGWVLDTDAPHFQENPAPTAPFSRPFDYNGDGAVDIVVKLSRRYLQCTGSCKNNLGSPASGDSVALSRFYLAGNAVAGDTPESSTGSQAWASYYIVMTSDGDTGFTQHDVIGTGIDCMVTDACEPYAGLPRVRRIQPVDINLDGLADLAWLDGLYDWKAQLNSGAGFHGAEIPIVDLSDGALSQFARFQDLNGDGYPEFLYPNLLDKDSAVWITHENKFGASFSTAVITDDPAGNTGQYDASLFVDVNGDGMLENLFVDLDASGTVATSSTKVFLGRNGIAGQGIQATNAVNSIINGFGAVTTIQYLPLTSTAVHTRTRNSKNALWGFGSPVYDLVAPIQVVSEVQSSAPVFGNPAGKSRVEYHYVGAKIQGGGRGFLGFAEVVEWNAQTGIRTNSRYRQDFPFVGRVVDVTRAIAGSTRKFDAVTISSAGAPETWPSVTATTAVPPVGGGGNILSHTINQWASSATTANPRVNFPYVLNVLERHYNLQGKLDRKAFAANTQDRYGNVLIAVTRTYAADDNSPVATRTIRNTFDVDVATWRLNLLIFTSTTHSRTGVSDIVRENAFGYDTATGLLNKETVEPNRTALKVTTVYQLDAFGNRINASITGNGMASRATSQVFDPLGRFATESRNAFNQLIRNVISWDAHGNHTVIEDVDGVRRVSAADHMGRTFVSASVTGARSKTVFRMGAGLACPVGDTAFYSYTTHGGKPDEYRCLDMLGREIRSTTQGFDGTLIHTDRYWDGAGRLERLSEPYYAGAARHWNLTAYDGMGRIDSVLAADGNDQTFDYDDAATGCGATGPRRTRTTNGLGQTRLEVRNALGERASVYDHLCGVVTYSYDATGNLTRISGADGATTILGYDSAGRKTSLDDPDKGRWLYAYNALGELTRQVDEKGQALDYVYDVLGRTTERRELTGVSNLADNTFATANRETTTFNNSTSASSKGKAQLLKVVYRNGESGAVVHQKDYTYDGFGRVSAISSTLDGFQWMEETTYDDFGRVFQQFDASGDDRGIRFHYNAQGYLEKTQESREGLAGRIYQQVRALDARGNATYMVLGNGVEAFASFAPESGRLQVLEAYDRQGAELQFVKYGFDALGNLMLRHDTSVQSNLREDFNYDHLNRLVSVFASANGGTAQSTLALQYDAGGNITNKSDVGSYLYGQNGAGTHAVTKAGSVTYTYDANGNQLTASNGRSISYSVFDKVVRVQNSLGLTEFGYGIGNQLVKRTDNNPVDGNRSVWYLGSAERIQTASGNTLFKRYLGDIAIADFYPSTGSQNLQYLLKDHLGSIHTLVPQSGLLANSVGMSFSAFGERRNATWSGLLAGGSLVAANGVSNSGFTGHRHSDAFGVIHMGGRIYDPKLGRFLQADPLVQAPGNSQSLNRYSYAFNNPLSFTDPSGYFSLSRFIKKWGRVVIAAVAAYYTFGAANGWATEWLAGTALAGSSAAAGAVAGGIAGFVSGAIVSGNLNGAVRGAFAGSVFGGVAGFHGNQYSVRRVAVESIAGGVGSLILGSDFEDGLVFALAVSSLSYANFKMRHSERVLSDQHPEGLNTNGESAGFFEDGTKMGGARRQVSADGRMLACVSPAGGCQGAPTILGDQRANLFGLNYKPAGVGDFVTESFAGPHDWFRNHVSRSYIRVPANQYDIVGNMKNLDGWRLQVDRFANAALIPVSVPFAVAGTISALVPLYTTIMQDLFQE